MWLKRPNLIAIETLKRIYSNGYFLARKIVTAPCVPTKEPQYECLRLGSFEEDSFYFEGGSNCGDCIGWEQMEDWEFCPLDNSGNVVGFC